MEKRQQATQLRQQPCPDCGSSDALTIYDDHTHCYACGKQNWKKMEEAEKATNTSTFDTYRPTPVGINISRLQDLSGRGVTKETCKVYGVWVQEDGSHVYPYFSKNGKTHLSNKFRNTAQKGFMTQGDISKAGLFGQQLFPPGSAKQITITEGELDALSVYQMMGNFPVVSVKGASSAPKDVNDNFDYLNSFDKIVLCFDKDEPHKRPDGTVYYPGQEAAEKVASMFPLGKVRLLTLKDAKDANDYLKNGWRDRFSKEWWGASTWSPVGIKQANDLWEIVRAAKYAKYESVPYSFEGLNKLTYGLRTSELVTITADPGVGKTSVLRETVFKILNTVRENIDDKRNIGVMYLEEPNKDTLYGLLSLYGNKPLHLPDVLDQTSEVELQKYFKDVYGDERIYLWDHFGSNDVSKVLNYVRYLANLGCKYIVLDHLSIIVSDQHGDERKQLDEIATKLKMLTMELDICVICIIHQNRKGEIRGTQGVEQLSNIVIKLFRDVKSDDPDVRDITKVTVEKNRFCGRTGLACYLRYDAETGRLTELSEEESTKLTEKTKKVIDEW